MRASCVLLQQQKLTNSCCVAERFALFIMLLSDVTADAVAAAAIATLAFSIVGDWHLNMVSGLVNLRTTL